MADLLVLGDYVLQVFLEDSVGLEAAGADLLSLKVKVQALEQQQYSTVKRDTVASARTFWGEHFYFRKTYTERGDLEDDEMVVSVYNYSQLLADALIGEVRMSLPAVHYSKDCAVLHQWHVLRNNRKDAQKAMGFLKLSVAFGPAGRQRVASTHRRRRSKPKTTPRPARRTSSPRCRSRPQSASRCSS